MSVNDQTKQSGEVIKGQVTMGDNGVLNPSDEWLDKALEGSDVTRDMIEKVQTKRDEIIAGAGLAVGEIGVAEFKKNKDLNQVSSELKFGKDTIGAVLHRTRNLPDGDGGMKEKKGVLSMSYKANGQIGSKGQLKKVKQTIAEMAADL